LQTYRKIIFYSHYFINNNQMLKCFSRVTLPSRNTNEILSTIDCDCGHFSNSSIGIGDVVGAGSSGAVAKNNVSFLSD
jgi:hypothetical protein